MGDALHLDSRSYDNGGYDGGTVGRELFRAALANVGRPGRRPVRRFSVVVDSDFQSGYLTDAMRASPGMDMDAVLAAPAMQRLEALRVSLRAEFCQTCDEYVLPASRVPCQRLRVLDLSGCTLGPPGAAAAFGQLKTLKMVCCMSTPESLQAMLDAAPSLARLWLESIWLTGEDGGYDDALAKRRVLLRCPATTVAVTLMHCHWTDGVDVDAPGARSLRYTGYLEHFPFTPATPSVPPANLEHVQLSFCRAGQCGCRPCPPSSSETPAHAVFWASIARFSRLRDLKLKLLDINDLAVPSEEEADALLKVFPNLNFLELQGSHNVDSHGAAVAIANLLQCCPALQEFHLNCKLHEDEDPYGFPKPDEKKAQLALEQSMESLKRLKSEVIPSPSSSGGGDDAHLAALKPRSFPCLERHLRKIRLEFKLKCVDCFEVKLAKFLVENSPVLETMEVHDGNHRVSDHIHGRIPIWRANCWICSEF